MVTLNKVFVVLIFLIVLVGCTKADSRPQVQDYKLSTVDLRDWNSHYFRVYIRLENEVFGELMRLAKTQGIPDRTPYSHPAINVKNNEPTFTIYYMLDGVTVFSYRESIKEIEKKVAGIVAEKKINKNQAFKELARCEIAPALYAALSSKTVTVKGCL